MPGPVIVACDRCLACGRPLTPPWVAVERPKLQTDERPDDEVDRLRKWQRRSPPIHAVHARCMPPLWLLADKRIARQASAGIYFGRFGHPLLPARDQAPAASPDATMATSAGEAHLSRAARRRMRLRRAIVRVAESAARWFFFRGSQREGAGQDGRTKDVAQRAA
ncbi:MAG: hypothetical protein AAF961_05260 [Planctomycetota bacterium]